MRCAIYCRVSTDEQATDERSSLDQQEEACRRYAEERGWEVVTVYREDYSAKTLDRPEMNRLRAATRYGSYDVVIVYVVDRWVRNHLDGNILLAELRDYDVRVYFVADNIDVNVGDGLMMLQFHFWKAQREREDIIRRTTSGKRGLLDKGIPLNLGPEPYGYRKKEGSKHWEIVEDEARVIRMIYEWVAAGRSQTSVAKQLNLSGYRTRTGKEWSRWGVRSLVEHPRNKGWTVADRLREEFVNGKRRQIIRPIEEWTILDTTGSITPAIVSEELWDAANHQTACRGADYTRNTERFYLLRGRIYCGRCGQRMYCWTHTSGREYYVCSSRHNQYHSKIVGVEGKSCDCPHIPVQDANAAVWQKIVESYERPEEILERYEQDAQTGPDPQLLSDQRQLTRMIADLEERETKLRRRIADEEDDELRADLRADWQEARRQKTEAQERLEGINDQLAAEQAKIDLVVSFVEQLQQMQTPGFLEDADDETRFAALNSLDVEVAVEDKRNYRISYYGRPFGFVTDVGETSSIYPRNCNQPLVTFQIVLSS